MCFQGFKIDCKTSLGSSNNSHSEQRYLNRLTSAMMTIRQKSAGLKTENGFSFLVPRVCRANTPLLSSPLLLQNDFIFIYSTSMSVFFVQCMVLGGGGNEGYVLIKKKINILGGGGAHL